MEPSKSHLLSLPSQNNYCSDFFPNFNDNSNLQSSESSISQQSSVQHNQAQNNNDFSINEQKLKLFQMQNVLYIWQTITKRIFVNRWMQEKDRMNRQARKTDNNITKVLLKIFYSMSVKLQVKYSLAFRKIFKNYQENKSNPQLIDTEKQHQGQRRKEKMERIRKGGEKISSLIQNVSKRYWFQEIQRDSFNRLINFSLKRKSLQFIYNLFEQDNAYILSNVWQSFRGWINYISKIQILQGTLNLLVHQQTRQVLWILKTQRPNLLYNDISNIQQTKSRKESMKMNNSSESLVLQKELLQSCKMGENKSAQQEMEYEQGNFYKKELPQTVQRNNPRHLKFTKDVKRKTLHTNQNPQEANEPLQNDSPQTIQPQQSSIIKPQNQDLSMIRRACLTMNSSMCQSRSILKKVFNSIELNLGKSPIIQTRLCDQDFTFQLNDGKINTTFHNNNKVTKVKPLKHQQLRKQFTDFNDLFSVREILSFYHSCKGQDSRKGISLAKIKQKVNIKTQEEYYSRQKLVTLPDQPKSLHKIVSQPNIDLSSRAKKTEERTYNSIKINNSHSRQRNYSNSKDKLKQKKSQFRIPKQLPKHFDYYIDKSLRRQQKIVSPQLNLHVVQLKRKSISSKSRKKLQFNVVKSGGTRLSGEHQDRKKKTEPDVNRISSPNRPIDLQLPQAGRQKRKSKQLSPSPNCEYYMAFRDPPKKKIKKNIAKDQ